MNKRIFHTLIMLVFLAGFSSCSKEDPVPSQQEIESNLLGKWKLVSLDGKAVATNHKSVCTYEAGSKSIHSASGYIQMLKNYVWFPKQEMKYSLTGNQLVESGNAIERVSSIKLIDSQRMKLSLDRYVYEGAAETAGKLLEMERISADYTNEVIGLWEGVEVTGEETYGGAEARIKFDADGSYTYYVKENGYWVRSSNICNEYFVDGNWLAARWCPEFGADFFYEWWDIESVTDTQMKWSALREKEDGTFFNTTFTWKKVKEAYPERLSSTWEYSNGSTGYRASLLIEELDGGQYGRFELVTPSHDGDFSLEGTFSYDATTGVGYVSNGMIGGYMVYVQASTATDREIDISVSRILSGERDILFEGTFSAK